MVTGLRHRLRIAGRAADQRVGFLDAEGVDEPHEPQKGQEDQELPGNSEHVLSRHSRAPFIDPGPANRPDRQLAQLMQRIKVAKALTLLSSHGSALRGLRFPPIARPSATLPPSFLKAAGDIRQGP